MWIQSTRGFVYLSDDVPLSKDTLAEIRTGNTAPEDIRMLNRMFASHDPSPDHTPRSKYVVQSDIYTAEHMLGVVTLLKIHEAVLRCEQFLEVAHGVLRQFT